VDLHRRRAPSTPAGKSRDSNYLKLSKILKNSIFIDFDVF
jgi:hypothetical protein